MRTIVLGIAALLLSSTAGAQDTDGERVVLHSDPNTHSTIYSFHGARIGTCVGDCTFVLPHGRYRVDVDETENAPSSSEMIDVYRPIAVNVTNGSKTGRTVGLTLGIVGTVAIPVGLVGMLLADHPYCGDCEHKPPTDTSALMTYGLVALAGVGLATIGWNVYSRSATKVRQWPPFDVAVVPTKNGAWSGVKIAF